MFVLVLPLTQLPPEQTFCVTVCVMVPVSSQVPEYPPHALQAPTVLPHDVPLVSRVQVCGSVRMGLPVTHDPPEQICGLTLRVCVPVLPHGSVNPPHAPQASVTSPPHDFPFWSREQLPCSCEVTSVHAPLLHVGWIFLRVRVPVLSQNPE